MFKMPEPDTYKVCAIKIRKAHRDIFITQTDLAHLPPVIFKKKRVTNCDPFFHVFQLN